MKETTEKLEVKVPMTWLAYITNMSPHTLRQYYSGIRRDTVGVAELESRVLQLLENLKEEWQDERQKVKVSRRPLAIERLLEQEDEEDFEAHF